MNARRWAIGPVFLVLGGAATGAELLRDFNDAPTALSSHPLHFVPFGNRAIFTANDGRTGYEPWVTDGTEGGTFLLADIRPGIETSLAFGFTTVGNEVFFAAHDGVNNLELWATDGTTAGTRIVANITPATEETPQQINKLFGPLTQFNGQAWFLHRDPLQRVALWRSDGTANGTVRINELPSSPFGPLANLQVFGNRMYFSYNASSSGEEMWSTDGTAAGTRMEVDLRAGPDSSSPSGLLVTSSGAYFSANDGNRGLEFWHIPAAGGAPVAVQDIVPGPAGLDSYSLLIDGTRMFVGRPGIGLVRVENGLRTLIATEAVSDGASMAVSRGLLLYVAYGQSTYELWASDGTPGSSRQVFQFDNSDLNLGPQDFRAVGQRALISIRQVGGGARLYSTDGTTAGTVAIDLIGPRTAESQTGGFAVINGLAYFFAIEVIEPGDPQNLGEPRTSLWRSDGTAAGTMRISGGVAPGFVVENDGLQTGRALVVPNTSAIGGELFSTDGMPGSLTVVRDIADGVVTPSSNPGPPAEISGILYFSALDSSFNSRLWRTDGTPAGTGMLDSGGAPLGTLSSGPPTAFGNQLLYSGFTEATGHELRIYDLTAGTDALLFDSAPGAETGLRGHCDTHYPIVGGLALFNAFDGQRNGIYVTDGTPAGTRRLISPASPDEQVLICHAFQFNGHLHFFDRSNSIWITDGTEAGTQRIFQAGHVLGARYVTVADGQFFFSAADGGSPATRQLWRSDGTSNGTFQVGTLPQEPVNITALGARIVFRSECGGPNSCSLFTADGTSATVQRLTSGDYGGPSVEQPFPVWRGRAWFHGTSADGVSQQNGVYSTDGLSVVRAVPLPADADRQFWPVVAVADRLVGISPLTPNQFSLWSSDGTVARTRPLAEFAGGSGVPVNSPWTALPDTIHLVGANLLFSASDGLSGVELWVIPDGRPSANPDSYEILPAGTATLDVLQNDGDLHGAIDPSTIEIVGAPSAGSAAANNSTGTIQYTPAAGTGGQDVLAYRVRDDQGNLSNVALVTINVARSAGPPPGGNPPPPPPPPPPGGGGGGGGGGGPADPALLVLISLLLFQRRRSALHGSGTKPPGNGSGVRSA